jgi:hypothetical protein
MSSSPVHDDLNTDRAGLCENLLDLGGWMSMSEKLARFARFNVRSFNSIDAPLRRFSMLS